MSGTAAGGLKRRKYQSLVCQNCGTTFWKKPNRFGNPYCGEDCYNAVRRAKKPADDWLRQRYAECHSCPIIAAELGVSQLAVQNWLKALGVRLIPLRGRSKAGLEAIERPTILDIAWAAGVYEGEGSCGRTNVRVVQKDAWLVLKLKRLFGGTITTAPARSTTVVLNGTALLCWQISGARGRGFLMTIYSFLSPRRQEQVRKALAYPGGG